MIFCKISYVCIFLVKVIKGMVLWGNIEECLVWFMDWNDFFKGISKSWILSKDRTNY